MPRSSRRKVRAPALGGGVQVRRPGDGGGGQAGPDRRITEEAGRLETRITEESSKLDRRITEEVSRLENRITEETAKLDRRITEEVSRLRTQVSNVRADVIRWMFVFWVGQIGVLLGIPFGFFRR